MWSIHGNVVNQNKNGQKISLSLHLKSLSSTSHYNFSSCTVREKVVEQLFYTVSLSVDGLMCTVTLILDVAEEYFYLPRT